MNDKTITRFWSKVSKSDGCWTWAASKRHKGYGAFVWADGSGAVIQGRAHRFSWELHNGPVPAGKCVLHRCDNPPCVRPDHLFIGSKAENNSDMRRKGRAVAGGTKTSVQACKYERGERHHSAKLSQSTVMAIRADRALGLSYSKLTTKYGITQGHVFRIANRQAWKHVV
jgi:hypothetical protein